MGAAPHKRPLISIRFGGWRDKILVAKRPKFGAKRAVLETFSIFRYFFAVKPKIDILRLRTLFVFFSENLFLKTAIKTKIRVFRAFRGAAKFFWPHKH